MIQVSQDEQYEIHGPEDLPLVKPPYGRITAIDLNTGEQVWVAPKWRRAAQSPAVAASESALLGAARSGGSSSHKDAASHR